MLTPFHQSLADRSDAEIAERLRVKEMQLRQVFTAVGLPSSTVSPARVGILGCGDKRFIPGHQQIFERVLERPIQMTTFDITVDHLQGAESGVERHDITQPLSHPPYDVLYSDTVIRFIDPAKQALPLVHAGDALAPGGMAVFTFGVEDYDPPQGYTPPAGTHPVDMIAIQMELSKRGVAFMEVPTTTEIKPPGSDDKIVIHDLAIVIKK